MNEHLKTMFESVDGTEKVNVLLVGQVYLDTILSIDGFPEEDAKKRASDSELRTGGNSCNTAEVLSQFNDNIQVFYMSAVGSKETSRLEK
jgi:ketohexokinase